jgi:release factor glutamine methyltransferase
MMNNFVRTILRPLPLLVRWYLSKKRIYRAHGLLIEVSPGVFHPGLFFSTEFLLQFISRQQLQSKSLLELGAGSGLLSLKAAQQGAIVTATDISTNAVENIRNNSVINSIPISVIQSDLFDDVPQQPFDWILINPPYYPKAPRGENDYPWYCGEHHEYFVKCFRNLSRFINSSSAIIMVLSDVCDLETIFKIGLQHGFEFVQREERRVWADGRNYIYLIKQIG